KSNATRMDFRLMGCLCGFLFDSDGGGRCKWKRGQTPFRLQKKKKPSEDGLFGVSHTQGREGEWLRGAQALRTSEGRVGRRPWAAACSSSASPRWRSATPRASPTRRRSSW